MGGQEIKLEGQEYLIMKEDDVLAVIEGHTKKKLAATKARPKRRRSNRVAAERYRRT
jgi:Chaperonin 10 Kd subunit